MFYFGATSALIFISIPVGAVAFFIVLICMFSYIEKKEYNYQVGESGGGSAIDYATFGFFAGVFSSSDHGDGGHHDGGHHDSGSHDGGHGCGGGDGGGCGGGCGGGGD